jgi:hypothetical protein
MGFPVKPIKGETAYSTRLTKPSKTGFKERPVVADFVEEVGELAVSERIGIRRA